MSSLSEISLLPAALIVEVNYNDIETDGTVTVTLDNGETFKTKSTEIVGEIMQRQFEANALLEEASTLIAEFLVKE